MEVESDSIFCGLVVCVAFGDRAGMWKADYPFDTTRYRIFPHILACMFAGNELFLPVFDYIYHHNSPIRISIRPVRQSVHVQILDEVCSGRNVLLNGRVLR